MVPANLVRRALEDREDQSLNPALTSRLTTSMRAGMAAVAVLWLAAGMVCIPSLTLKRLSSPVVGLLATFQIFVQHVFLSVFVGAFVLKPDAVYRWFGLSVPLARDHTEHPMIPSQANV